MAPKSTPTAATGELDINTKLLVDSLVATLKSSDAKIDTATLAVLYGFEEKNRKNVPRKLDTLLKPYGYANKQGKIITLDEAAALPPSAVKSTANKVDAPAVADAVHDEDDDNQSPTPTPKKRKVNTGKGKPTAAAVKELTPKSSVKDEGDEED